MVQVDLPPQYELLPPKLERVLRRVYDVLPECGVTVSPIELHIPQPLAVDALWVLFAICCGKGAEVFRVFLLERILQ